MRFGIQRAALLKWSIKALSVFSFLFDTEEGYGSSLMRATTGEVGYEQVGKVSNWLPLDVYISSLDLGGLDT